MTNLPDRPDVRQDPDAYVRWLVGQPGHGCSWFVVVVLAQHEIGFAYELAKDGIECYVPVRRTYGKLRFGRRRTILRPLIPGYAFAEATAVAGGVCGLLQYEWTLGILPAASEPRRVPTIEIERLRRLEAAGEWDETIRGRKGWNRAKPPTGALAWIRRGAEIVVVDGPFRDREATIAAIDVGRRRVKAELMVFGGSTPVELEFAQFRRA